jgi:hypothetical protein
MRSRCWMYFAVAFLFALGTLAFADHDRDRDEHDRGRGHGAHYRDSHYRYDDRDRHQMRAYYNDHYRNLPPGLAKRDRLPPGLERRLRVHYVMDDEMRGYMRPCPPDLEERLPPPPPHCAHTIIGGHVVLVNSNTHVVLDIFHFDR